MNIQLLQELLKNQIVIPNAAVRRGAPNGVVSTFVYVVKSDDTVTVRPVTLGVVDGERVAVTAGLAAGEIVVTEGAIGCATVRRFCCRRQRPLPAAPRRRREHRSPELPARTAGERTPNLRNDAHGGSRMNPSRIFILRPVATTLLMLQS